MGREEIIRSIATEWWPDWEAAPKASEVILDIGNLYRVKVCSSDYYQLKSKILGYIGMNLSEQTLRGKTEQGRLTSRLFQKLNNDLSVRELE